MRLPSSPTLRSPAFSLVELLVTIAVGSILAALVGPSLSAVVRGSQLTQAANMVNDEINLARQHALSRNRIVEVRLYLYRDSETSSSQELCRALQIFEIGETGSARPLGKVRFLPSSIIIDSGVTLSSLLKPSQDKTWTVADPKLSLPRLGTNYSCRAFRLLPDGSADLAPQTDCWFLTLHNIADGDALPSPPRNFFCLQIDTCNGQTRTFRP